ncbi:MAG TPA: hypothetical protein VHO25_08080, partial [Polyangiaceae bacterium]|nr:hypothetical protein [Polyangiaceae bacterium]
MSDSNEGMTFLAPYCVAGDTLRFGSELNVLWPGTSDFTLQRVNCADGLQSAGEDGIDCGRVCPEYC